MCTMRIILCYILLICTVTNCFANNEEKELSQNEYDQISEENFEEEARKDIYNLLQHMIKISSENKNYSKAHNITDLNIIIENNETLADRLDDVLKQLGIKRRHINDTISSVDENLRLDDQFEWDQQDLSFNARHRDFMKNLASSHRDVVKNRMLSIVKDTRFEDQTEHEHVVPFELLIKNLDSNHINAVKNRVNGGNMIHRSLLNSDYNNKVMQLAKNLKVRSLVYPEVVLPTDKDKGKPAKEDVTFTDLLSTASNNLNNILNGIDIKPNTDNDKDHLFELSDINKKTSNMLHLDNNDQLHQVDKPVVIKHRDESAGNIMDMKFADLLELENYIVMDPPVKKLGKKHTDQIKEIQNDMRTTDMSHLNNINLFHPIAQNLHTNEIKKTGNGIKTADNLHLDNINLFHPIAQNLHTKHTDEIKKTGNYMKTADMLHLDNINKFHPIAQNLYTKHSDDIKKTGNNMKTADMLHLDNINKFHPIAQKLYTKHTDLIKNTVNDIRNADMLHSDNNNVFVQKLDITHTDKIKETGNYIKSTDKMQSEYYVNHSDLLFNKMYIKHLEDSKITGKKVDMLSQDTKNQSRSVVKNLDLNNRVESTANVSSHTIFDQSSDNMLNTNSNAAEHRPVKDLNAYKNGNYSTPSGRSVVNEDILDTNFNELIYRPVKDLDVYMNEQNNTAENGVITDDMLNSDSNYHLRLLMKNLGIQDSHDKQKIIVNLKQNTDRFEKNVKKINQNKPGKDNEENTYIAHFSYRPQQSINSYNDAPMPALINLGRPVYQRLRTSTKPQPVSEESHGSRVKRSTFTQAGYTQDPDTCKTYNENLVKLWSNLSKFINVTEQPNERALHNIAVMIQAYLDHQNTKSTTESNKVKHEGSRDKLTEVILKIKKLFEEGDGSPERVTKIIIKHLKPFYGDVENAECQQVNEESLGSSIELLYKNYLENAECHNDGKSIVRNKNHLRKRTTKNLKAVSSNWHSSNDEYKPEVTSIIIEDELYKDFHKGKTPRERPAKFRRVYKRNKNLRSLSYTSGDQNDNDSEKFTARSKVSQKSSNKKLKKHSLKTDETTGKCEKYAIRKFAVSLRPVMERYMALLECQLDNTLRSLNYDRVSMDPYYLYASKFYSNEDSLRQKKLLRNTKFTRKHTERSRNISRKKSKMINHHDTTGVPDNTIFVQIAENNYPQLRKYSLKEITGMNSPLSVPNRFTDLKESNTNGNNEDNTKHNEYFQSPPLYDDYDGIYKTDSVNPFVLSSVINPFTTINDDIDIYTGDKRVNKNLVPPVNDKPKEHVRNNDHNIFYEDEFPEELISTTEIGDQQTDTNDTGVPGFTDLTKLRDAEEITTPNRAQGESTLKSYESITEFLKMARDASLQTPEFAVPFALDTNKGYVEISHLIKYPKIIVYRPQFIVKNTMPYDDFLKTINNINMTNDDVRLMKIVRHLPDNTVKVLFETEDFESPLEVLNVNDHRRSGSSTTEVESGTDTSKKNYESGNADYIDEDSGESFSIYRDNVHSNIVDSFGKSGAFSSDENDLQYASNSNPDSNSTVNSASNGPFNSSSSSVSIPRLASGLIPDIASEFLPSLSSSLVPGRVTAIATELGAGIGKSLDKALSLGSALKLSPILPSQLSSYINKFIPSYSNSQSKTLTNVNELSGSQSQIISKPDFNLHSLSDSNQNSGTSSMSNSKLLVLNRIPEFENAISSTTQSTVNRWWNRWKNIFKGKIKKLVRKMAKVADNIDDIV